MTHSAARLSQLLYCGLAIFLGPLNKTQSVAVEAAPAPPRKELPLPGEVFAVGLKPAFVISAPSTPANRAAKPWVWYAPTLPGLPAREEQWMFEQFTQAGIGIGGIDVGESYGSPAGRKLFTDFYQEMTLHRGYSAKPVLLGRSRGGLMTLGWAVENPDKVGGFAGIYPVCNIASYPGVAKAAPAYEMTVEGLQAALAGHNPVDRLQRLAQARVPLFAIHGDADQVVPLAQNSGLMKERYEALGGSMELIVPAGQGHNMWEGFFRSAELVRFVKAHAGPNLTLSSPLDYQVVQRSAKNLGVVLVEGDLAGTDLGSVAIEAQIGSDASIARKSVQIDHGHFQIRFDLPAGGWHSLSVRARSGEAILAEAHVDHVGVGEVFVIAGQSNSANHGEEKQNTTTGLVASFDGRAWRLANDPQPGASGNAGSFIPPFGDAIAGRFHVPVGIVACGVGATSVREWLPKGDRFPNPPTLLGNVQQLPNGEWESKGAIYDSFTARMKQLGPHGFRAVLWHQGESDANQSDSTRTLSGPLYTAFLKKLIQSSRSAIGWDAPWFVAQASYHTPSDPGSAEIQAAQAALWQDGTALQGPNTDALTGEMRDNHGQGVHFSAAGLRQHAALWFERVAPWLEQFSH